MDDMRDWDLWNWKPEETTSWSQHQIPPQTGSFVYQTDTIEEDAMNERSCIEVLRILIKNADNEIDKLEKELELQQITERIWRQNAVRFKVWCDTLLKKTAETETTMMIMANTKFRNIEELQYIMFDRPVKTLNEILEHLLLSENSCTIFLKLHAERNNARTVEEADKGENGESGGSFSVKDEIVAPQAKENEVSGAQSTIEKGWLLEKMKYSEVLKIASRYKLVTKKGLIQQLLTIPNLQIHNPPN